MDENEEMEGHPTVTLTTGCGCCMIEVLQRCRKADNCGLCQSMWIRGLYRKFYTRKRRSDETVEQAILWTLGTSSDATDDGRALLADSWRLFRMWMDNYSDWKPIFRVVETGAKGGKLHIHFIATRYLEHEVVLEAWRTAIGEKANVNFSYIPGYDGENILGYLLKYLTKEDSKYSWLGTFYKAGEGEKERRFCEHGRPWEFPDFPTGEVGPDDERYYYR